MLARRLRWGLVVLGVVVGLVLGWIGLGTYYAARARSLSFGDRLYADLRMLFITGGPPPPPLPWTLDVAQFLLPAAVGLGAFSAVAALFHDRIALARLPFLRRHVVIVGLGEIGGALARNLGETGADMVAIELDPSGNGLEPARAAGAVVIVGDGTDPAVLAQARVGRARRLIATADDTTNAEIALRALSIGAASTGPPLDCHIHITDPELARLFQLETFRIAEDEQARVDVFSVHDLAARVLLSTQRRAGTRTVVLGSGPTATRLVFNAVTHPGPDPESRRVTLVDTHAQEQLAALITRSPWLAGQVETVDVAPDARGPVTAAIFGPGDPPATVFALLEEPAANLGAALALREAARVHGSTVVAGIWRSGALAGVLHHTLQHLEEAEPALRIVSLPDVACTADLVTGGLVERLARGIHDAYRARQLEEGADRSDPAVAQWDELPETLRDSNRHQAAHYAEKLRGIGCDLVNLDGPSLPAFDFRADELEVLARLEHERWVTERRRDGWQLGPRRDPEARTSPYLVEWEALTDDVRDLDRDAVHEMPELLRRAGYAIIRLPDGRPSTPSPRTAERAGPS
jgi:voltage-gated potassium channel Kch